MKGNKTSWVWSTGGESLLSMCCARSNCRTGRPCSNIKDTQQVQSWKPEEQPKLVPGITRLLFSQTAAISLYRVREVMDMAFMPALHLTFLPSPSFYYNRRKSLSHCCSNTPTMVLGAADTPKTTLLYLLDKSLQMLSKHHLIVTPE